MTVSGTKDVYALDFVKDNEKAITREKFYKEFKKQTGADISLTDKNWTTLSCSSFKWSVIAILCCLGLILTEWVNQTTYSLPVISAVADPLWGSFAVAGVIFADRAQTQKETYGAKSMDSRQIQKELNIYYKQQNS